MKKITILFVVLFSQLNFAQIKGTVTDEKGNPIPFVSVFIDNTYVGTTTNEQGQYELRVKKPTKSMVVFQNLGFKTKKIKFVFETYMQTLDVQLLEENITINEVVIDSKNNPANEVIKNAIENRKENSKQTSKYTADFYSRGIFKIKDAPKKILGQKFDFFDEMLDSTRSGILYLSETVSRITFQKPDKLKETIVASKVSGNDNGYSFNTAASANFDFYENYLPFQVNVVSPIADNAFNYYKYKLEGTFFDDNNKQINKVKVTPKRITEPVMEGYIYIVDDSWAIYAVDLKIKGDQMQTPALNTLSLKQSFNYNSRNKTWVKNTQTLDFVAGLLGVNLSGRFTYVYNNYIFEPKFDKKTFSREVVSFENEANKKENSFWDKIRPVPLTAEESTDYLKKDLLQTKKKSKIYLDSIDRKGNKFGFSDPIMGYTSKNSFQKWEFKYDGLLKGFHFNTVQGWTLYSALSYTKTDEDKRTFSGIKANFDFGFSEKKLRTNWCYVNKFNNQNQSEIRVSAGSAVAQFNSNNPISTIVNSVSTLFFKNNFIKLYENNFADISFKREVTNGIFVTATVNYSERKPLFNTTDFAIIKSDDFYTSNNPLLPFNNLIPVINKHNLAKATVIARINFAQEYWSRPDGKFNLPNDKYPALYIGYEKGFAGSDKRYEYDHINARLTYDVTLGNKGNLAMNIKGGKFYNATGISFVDYKHFNGNQTHIGQADRYLNVFNLLPYYANSTNDSYIESHFEHDDKGYLMNKIPLLNKLKSTMVLGYHSILIPKKSPYHEFTVGLDNLGFGKFKIFRLDYVRSYQNGYQGDGVVFGLKFLNVLN
jgi:Family of unknown function (DUF5686)/CarboxypepD_reg-like domain